MNADEICRLLQKRGCAGQARLMLRFFKTGPGQYGEGYVFAGIAVPELRRLAGQLQGLPLSEAARLLASPMHEARLLALLILIAAFKKEDSRQQDRIYRLYLKNTRRINSWDLVDASAHHIMGDYLFRRCREPLYRLAASPIMWERRIAVIATLHFIRKGEYADTLRIADMLLADREDLIHKAVGWMLREIGKRDGKTAHEYLEARCRDMPRTMLRSAIERFPEHVRRKYLHGAI